MGQLGRAVLEAASTRGWSAVGHDLDTLDITDPEAVSACVQKVAPEAVLNCAAFTAVDTCEADEATATSVNGTAVAHLAAACNHQNALLVQVSTDYVFPGTGTSPYKEDTRCDPINAYGRGKLVGEQAAADASNHLIARTAWLYGIGGQSFLEAIRRQIDGGADSLRVVADQTGCPTFCDDVAVALLDLIQVRARGVVHVVNSGTTTWHGFACEIVRRLGAAIPVHPVSTAEFPRPAARPRYSVLDTSRLESLLGRMMPSWQDALGRYLERA
jgi:dTDP-4-dehydrorhamnose reductase